MILKAKKQTQLVERPKLKQRPHKPKPSVRQNIFTIKFNTMGNSLLWGSNFINPKPKRSKNLEKIIWTKSLPTQIIKLYANFFKRSCKLCDKVAEVCGAITLFIYPAMTLYFKV